MYSLYFLPTLEGADTKRYEESAAEFAKAITDPKLIHAPVCIVANKQDLADPPLTKSDAIKVCCIALLFLPPAAIQII